MLVTNERNSRSKESMAGEGQYAWFTSRRMTMALIIWAIVGNAAWLGLNLMWKPWSTEILGYVGSPQRNWAVPILTWLQCPPVFLLVIQNWLKHPEWTAPRGRYTPGRIYPLFSAYNIVGIALIAAAMTASGFIVSPLFDLPIFFAWIASFYFNPWIAGLGCGTSIFLRSIIWGGSGIPFALGNQWMDTWAYSTIGLLTLHILEPRRGTGIRLTPYYALVVIMSQVVQRIMGTFLFIYYSTPMPALIPTCWAWLVMYTIGPGWATAAIALAISETAIRMTTARVRVKK